jgi:hypothetical protein
MTHLSGFGDALLYMAIFALFIPLANIVLIPLLVALIHKGFLAKSVWRKALVANGLISVIPSWFILEVLLSKYIQEHMWSDINLLDFAPYVFLYFGYVLQTFFLIVWLTFFLWRKELPNRFYKSWGWGFFMLYIAPYFIYLSLVTVSFILRT